MRVNGKLDKKNIENIMVLTNLQQGMLFHYISDDQSSMYHEQLRLTIKGDIKIELFQKAWKYVIENNEALRTVFRWKGIEKPLQVVLKNHEISIKYLDFTDEINKEESINEIKSYDLKNKIDITRETLRIYLCKLDENMHDMIISNHHILYDGWSNGIIIKELMETYSLLYKGEDIKRIDKTKFSEFIKYINNINKDDERKYWSKYLENIESRNDCFSCKEVGTYKETSYKIDNSKVNRIIEFSKENKILLSSMLYGAWAILLQKFSNSNEVIFGATVSGRPENIKAIDKIVGLFINTIPLRVKLDKHTTVIELVRGLHKNLNRKKDFEHTALIDIKEYSSFRANEEIFNSIVAIENYPLDLNINRANVLSVDDFSIVEQTNYNMTLEILTFDGIEFKFKFNSLSIHESIVEKFGIYLERIIDDLVNSPNITVRKIDLLSEVERNQILYRFNDTKGDYPKNKTIQELFEQQAEKTPNSIAVVFEDRKLTYRELNEKANSLARVLREKGVKADTIVALMVERSIEMIIGIMATLKAGGAYLPIDPTYPKERIEYMLKDSESKVLLSKNTLVENLVFDGEIIDLLKEELFQDDVKNLVKINNSNNLAYIIYTSGTTGNPKGVMIEHRALVNRLNWMQKKYPLNEKDVILQKTTYTFDVSVWELLWWSLIGAKVCMLSLNDEKDSMKIIKAIDRYEITTMHFVPSMLDVFLHCVEENRNNINLSSLRQVFSSGEALNFKQVLKFYREFERGKKLINLYGPTEATIDVSYFDCINDNTKVIPIGKPIDNTKLYILKDNNIVPIGVAGELCISGDGLARGYLKRPELTAEKFIDNPFEADRKMYKTGDLARWLPDGNIEFLGRIDNQVKIRGFRIELGEIESRLLQHEEIKEAAVLVKENKEKEKNICAYIISEKSLEKLNLKSYLKEILPEYMVPIYFVQIEKMPLTSNGKLDRRSLLEIKVDVNLTEYEAPKNKTQETLVKIWSEVLGREKIGINDNFFDLGGHSLKATMLMAKIHKQLNKEVPLKELFKSPTIKEISKYIESAKENLYSRIERVEEKEYYEASSAQKRMYMLQKFDKKSVAYNMTVVFELEGDIDRERIVQTFKKLSLRHEALRTYFKTIDGEIVQLIDKSYEFELVERKDKEEIDKIINKFVKPFELEKAPLFRVEFLENYEKVYLLIDMHHIISDGVSMNILTQEFSSLYNGETLEELRIQYKDFAQWQNSFLKSEEMKKQEEYWLSRFEDEVPVLNMPTDYERSDIQSFEGNSVGFQVDEKTTKKLRKLTKETGTTIHMVLLSALNILLSKYSGEEDIVVGTPIAARPHENLQNIMGMFVNTLALRNKPEGDKKYIDFLKEVKENSLKAYENQSYQFETLVDKLDIRRDTSRNPLFDVMFNMIDTVRNTDIKIDKLLLKLYNDKNKISKFDLTLNAIEEDVLKFTIEYSVKLFNKESIKRLSNHYINVLTNIIENTEIKISEIGVLLQEEKNQILYEFNDTKKDCQRDRTIVELFEEQVEKSPNNIAVVFEDKKLTYRELNEKANSLARVLREKGVKADTIVALMVERSIEMIIGIMATLKAGGAYLPIGSAYPKERIEFMLKDSDSKIMLCENRLLENIEFDGEIIDLFNQEIFKNHSSNLEKINKSNDLAYVIYTSGTTGNPKGVMCEHRNVVRLVKNTNYIEFKEQDKILQTGAITFDASIFEVWGALLNGLELYLVKNEIIIVPKLLEEFVVKNKITVVLLISELFNQIAQKNITLFKELRYLLVGGDVLSPKYISLVRKECKNLKMLNAYGPTENTTLSTTYSIEKEYSTNVPIGKPIANSKAYIVDKNNRLMPIGVHGELCVSGDGLARGYLKRPELTVEKFVDNPFEAGRKMYKTGDLARWLPDGNIEFLGRIDNQVKIRGFRIELGEIESRLLQHEEINEAAVLVKENKEKEKNICAYIVSEKSLEKLNLKSYLKEILPEYMVPTYFVQIEKMPLTSNGKLDRRSLLEIKVDVNLTEYEAPRNKTQEALVKIWSEVLGREKIGINDNFFDLGGHSLKATMLMAKIHKQLNKEVPLKELFKSPTIKEISKYIESAKENLYSRIERVEEKEYYEASSAQKRMYMLQKFDKKSVAYNMPVVFELEGDIDRERIVQTFKKLSLRHEALRTYFKTIDGEIVQLIDKLYEFELVERKDKEETDKIINKFVKPFELEKAPLFRVELLENYEKVYLLIDMHHIISDGVSMNILTQEFSSLYNGETLEELRIQYKDFAQWQNSFLKSEEMKKQEEYWLSRFEDEVPVLNMPIDYKRPDIRSFEGDSVEFQVDEKTIEKLRKLTKETGTTMHMVLLSALNILLSKYSGEEDIVVGTPIVARPHENLQNIMGMFVNTLALMNRPESDKEYTAFLKEVKENFLKAYDNQSYQFETLVDKLDIRRDTSRNPLFDVMFNMVDTVSFKVIALDGLLLKPYIEKNKISKFDLTLNVLEDGNILRFSMDYCSKLFKKDTIERLSDHYVNVLESIIANTEIKISEIELLTEKERNQILYEFNDTKVDFPKNKTIHELFEEQVEQKPDNIAVVFGDDELTYKDLNKRANQIARMLKNKGVKADTIVGIMAERSIELIIGMIGILKAGGAYLTIDPDYPKKRIEYMLEDSKIHILLSMNNLMDNIEFAGEIVDLLSSDLLDEDLHKSNSKNINAPSNLAYIIYTSGTTGKPKGVMIEHSNVVRLLYNDRFQFKFDEKDTWTMFHSPCFDFSVWEMYGALLYGGRLVVIPKKVAQNSSDLLRLLKAHNVTVLNQTPSAFLNIIKEEVKTRDKRLKLRYVIFGGEALKPFILKEWRNKYPNTKLINMYGITETTVHSTFYEIGEEDIELNISNIGKPIPTTTIYIMDKNRKLLPKGVLGEIVVGGHGVARGYLNREELTAEKFIENPYKSGERLYRSGDLARFLYDGSIEYCSRIDHQVKIRGFRIELGEIENLLLKHPKVKEVVLMVKERSSNNKYLCAYIVLKEKLLISELKQYLSDFLPQYMMPSYFVQLDKLPLTFNGKVDMKALPDPTQNIDTGVIYATPKNDIEKILAKIWGGVLGIEKISTEDSFFDLGGDSLLVLNMHNEIEKYFKGEVTVANIFSYPTISKLSKYIEKNRKCKQRKIELSYISLPKEYFSDENSKDEILEFSITGRIYENIIGLAEKIGTSTYIIFLSLYGYLLSQVANMPQITIQTIHKRQDEVVSLDIDISTVEDVGGLIQLVNKLQEQIKDQNRYTIQEILGFNRNRDVGFVIPLIYKKDMLSESKKLIEFYDMVLEIYEKKNCIGFIFEYNTGNLNGKKQEDMIKNYIKLIQTVGNSFNK